MSLKRVKVRPVINSSYQFCVLTLDMMRNVIN